MAVLKTFALAALCVGITLLSGAADARQHRLRAKVLSAGAGEAQERWEAFDAVPLDAQTDGQMHWLRSYYYTNVASTQATFNGIPGLMGVLSVGAANIAAAQGGQVHTNGFDINPAADPILTHALTADFVTLSAGSADWVSTQAAAINLLAASGGHVLLALEPFVGGGGAVDPFNGCSVTIADALIHAGNGHGGTNRNKAAQQLLAMGGKTTCDIALTLGQLQAITAAIAAHTTTLTLAQLTTWKALTSLQREWVIAQRVAFLGLGPSPGAGGGAPLVLPPAGGYDTFNPCHASLVDAFAHGGAGHGANNRAQALWKVLQMGGKKGCLKITRTLAEIQSLAGVLGGAIGWLNSYEGLHAHYTRFQALLPAQNYDLWVLRGWVYATDRARGHRLVGASGYTEHLKGENQGAWEPQMLRRKASNNAETYGVATDTVGHVRPRGIGGQRDPLNFVPQSQIGQKMVNAAETIARTIAEYCNVVHGVTPPNQGRYSVIFTYPGAANARRPTDARTVVDLLNNCHCDGLGPNAHVAPITPFFDWNGSTW